MGELAATMRTIRTARNVLSAVISSPERPPEARSVNDYNGYRAENVSDRLVIKNVSVKTATTREVKRYQNNLSSVVSLIPCSEDRCSHSDAYCTP